MLSAIMFQLRAALTAAERRLEDSYSLPLCLQPWLQLTYDVESRYFETKRKAAEAQLKAAKEMVSSQSCCSNLLSLDNVSIFKSPVLRIANIFNLI